MAAGRFAGKTLHSIIPPGNVQQIALTKHHSKGSPVTQDFRPDYNSNDLLNRLFSSNETAKDLSLSASEFTLAEYTIVIFDYQLFVVEVFADVALRNSVSAITLVGEGFGCRFSYNQENDAPNGIDAGNIR
jgi:hypothetical protein